VLIHRQARIAAGQPPRWSTAFARAPAAVGAWLVYTVLLLALALPWLALSVAAIVWTQQLTTIAGLVATLLGYLLLSLLAAIPLTWAGVAFGFAPFASAIEPIGPLAAQRHSARRVRGHWVAAGVVISLPMLIYVGAAGTVSSLVLLGCGTFAYALGGWARVLEGSWLAWSNWIALLPNAALLPLAVAGGVVGWHDLNLRAEPRSQESSE
jgi:hypothetical protein